ncbi:Hypothetical predicted protein [Paramuricea clavata]|uniref:Uncharacterized protein n=2 Tax=Paramuricea clavata TaxID=317549 RepID=A0A6S7LED3_PARCT|nr:Hypothetical predicted protein [Paramuricea clavata]
MDLLRKQLNEKEVAYKEEHSRAEGLAVKVKEQRDEIVQGMTKQKTYETAATQKIKALEKENEALKLRMNASHQNNALEHEKLVAALEICKKTHVQTDWQKLQEDLASAKDIIQHSENQKAELEARILALETDIDSRKENEAKLAQQAAEANDRVKNFDAVKNSLTQQLMETVKSKSDSEQRLDMAKKETDSAHTEKSNAVQKAGALQSQLDEERSKKSEMEKMFKALELKLKDTSDKHVQEKEMLVQQLESASGKKDDTQIAEFQKQSEDASRQLDELKAKLAQAEEDHGKTKQSLTSREEQLSKHEGEISNLKGLNCSKDEELELLRKTVSQHENEIVVMKNNMSQELQSAPPEVDDAKVKGLEEEIEKLNGQLDEKKEQIATWEKSIETMKAKNNELREKNWKAMDALSAAEKQHKVETGKAVASVKEENKKNLQDLHTDIKEFLCRIHPTLSIDKDLSYEDFLKKYENETEELGCRSPKSESNDSKIEELEEELKKYIKQNEEVTSQCAEYKTNLDSKVGDELNLVL